MDLSRLISIVFLSLSLCACSSGGKSGGGGVDIIRYDKTQYEYIEFNSFDANQRMKSDYYPMTKLLVEDILEIGSITDDDIQVKFREYYSDSLLLQLIDDVEAKFDDVSDIERQLTKAFASLHRQLPGVPIPKVYSQLSALNESIIMADTLLGISLDKYMGADYPLYKSFYYSYQRRSMEPDRIDNDCIVSLMRSAYPFDRGQSINLCNLMIHYGRLAYVSAKVLDITLREQLDFTEDEWQWCEQHEKEIFRYVLEHGHLYSTNFMVLRKYLRPSPYVPYFGKHSPSCLGIWIGARIIESYVSGNDVSLNDLMNITNYKHLLINSHYLNLFV